jgi:hypothetical protein
MSSGSIGETAARFLDEKNPWCVIPDVAALDQGIDFATNKLDERKGLTGGRATLGLLATRRRAGGRRVR